MRQGNLGNRAVLTLDNEQAAPVFNRIQTGQLVFGKFKLEVTDILTDSLGTDSLSAAKFCEGHGTPVSIENLKLIPVTARDKVDTDSVTGHSAIGSKTAVGADVRLVAPCAHVFGTAPQHIGNLCTRIDIQIISN